MPTGSGPGSHTPVSEGVHRASIRRQAGPLARRLLLFLWGRLRAEAGGAVLDICGKKAQGLLAYLALPPGRRYSREHLASLLWGGMRDDQARHNLRQCVSTLRRLLGSAAIVSEGDALYLDAQGVEVDVAALEGGDVERMTGLGGGDLLEGLGLREDPFDEWLADQRARLRGLVCDRLGELAAARARAGAVQEAIDIARRLLAIDQASEDAHRLLMELYARCGRRTEAIRQYELCVEALQRHLGVGPSPETVRLYESFRCPPTPDPCEPRSAEGPPLPGRPSIVVLTFSNLSGEVEQDYFGIGIAEDIAGALSRFGSLFVISAATAYALRGRALEPRRIGRELGVHYVVQGSVRRSADRVRVNVHLVDARSGNEVWAQRYDGGCGEIFEMQDRITRTLVATLVSRVEAASLERARRKAPESLAAYECYLRGKYHHHRRTLEDNTLAIEMFERATAIDPTYVLAYAWLACALVQRRLFSPDDTLFARSFGAIEKAYALDDGESEVHRVLAAFYLMWRQLERAEYHQDRALAINPNNDRIVCQMGDLLTYLGRPEDGERWVRQAMRLNPYHPSSYWLSLARALYHQRHFENAVEALRRVPAPTAPDLLYTAAALARLGRTHEARAVACQLGKLKGVSGVADIARALPYRRCGDLQDLTAALQLAGLEV